LFHNKPYTAQQNPVIFTITNIYEYQSLVTNFGSVFQGVHTVVADIVPVSAFPDTNAAGESVEGLVRDTAVPHFTRSNVIVDAEQREDEIHVSQGESQTGQNAGESHVPDAAVGRDDSDEIIQEIDSDSDESLTAQTSASDVSEVEIPDDDGLALAAMFHDADVRAGEPHIADGEFQAVESALQNAGLLAKPAVPPVDRAAKMLYDATVRAVRRVLGALRSSAS